MSQRPPSRPARRRERESSGQERASARQRREAAARRQRQRTRLGWAVGAVVALALIALAVYQSLPHPVSAGPVIDGVQCNPQESAVYHIHQHLAIYDLGQTVTLPAGIGIDQAHGCLYWLHTHATDGVIHVESPSRQQYTLGTFFDIWGQSLSRTALLGHAVDAGHAIRVYTGTRLYTGDPRRLLLTSHELITMEYGPPWVAPPPYIFTGGE